VTRARTARTAISAVLAHPRHGRPLPGQSTLPDLADPSATLVPPLTLSCSLVSVVLGATPNELVAGLGASSVCLWVICLLVICGRRTSYHYM